MITVSSSNTDVTVSPATLTFTRANWSTAQTVTVRAAQDADAVNDAASITHAVDASSSADEYDAATIAGVAVTVTDDETAGVTVSETTLTVAEGGSGSYTVVLDAQPASNVVINVTKSGSPDVTVTPATLTFSTSNWDTAQTVTVSAAQDADAVNDAASITHAVVAASSADEFDAVTIAGVTVSVTDDDTAGATVSPATLRIPEGGSATYTVVLDAQPASDVVISVTKSGSPDVTVSPATLTFTPSNWSTTKTVTVSAAQDADAVNDAATIAHAVVDARSADEYDNVTIAGVTVTVTDDDTAGATVSETTLTVAEGGSATYTVVLDAQPASDVVINVTKSGSPDVTVSPATLTFTPANWSTAQTVTVRAAQDADAANDSASIAHAVVDASSADEFDAVTIAGVRVTVTDAAAAGATVSETTLTVAEGGSATYTVVLDAQPSGNVVISVTRSGSPDVTVSPATLTFTSSNWDTAQTVRVSAAQDADAANDAASITHAVDASSSADEYDAATIAGVTVTVTDDDTAGATVSATTLTVAEGGSGSYTVVLDVQPASNVVIGVTRSGSPDVDGVSGHLDLLLGQLEHGADGKGVRRRGRRRGERRGLHHPRGGGRQQRRRVRRRDHRRGVGDRHRRRHRRGGGDRHRQRHRRGESDRPESDVRLVDGGRPGLHSRRRRRDGEPAPRSSGQRQAAIQPVARPARGAALQLGPDHHRHAQGEVPQDAVHLYRDRWSTVTAFTCASISP